LAPKGLNPLFETNFSVYREAARVPMVAKTGVDVDVI